MSESDSSKVTTPPWGTDAEFDPAKAWTLIQNLRSELTDTKGKLTTATTALGEREDAEKTETQKLADRLTAAEKRATDANREVLVTRAQRKHNLPDEVLDFLTGDTEDEIEAKALRLASLNVKGQAPETDGTDKLSSRPQAKLTPGHGGEPAKPIDAAALAEWSRASR